AQFIVESQPMKLAAAEALWETSDDPAPFTVFAKIDEKMKENSYAIEVPGLLSLLAYDEFSGTIKGMNELQTEYEEKYGKGNYIPPVKTVFWSFRTMVASGTLMFLLSLYGIYALRKNKIEGKTRYLKWMVFAIILPFIGYTTGWLMSEMGSQTCVVFRIMENVDDVSQGVILIDVILSFLSLLIVSYNFFFY